MPAKETPVIIEAAINGGTTKERNPHVPRTPAEIAAEALRCLAAGATIVHNHNDNPVLGSKGAHDPQPYIEAWRQVLAQRPDAIFYPTMGSGGPGTDIEERYSHVPALARAGVLGLGLIDPGSVNLGGVDEEGLPRPVDSVYINTYRDARHMFDTCNGLGCGASISIFEPGFLRVVLAYHRVGKLPRGSQVKFYFGGGRRAADGSYGLGFGLPPILPSLEAYLAMIEGTGIPWSVAVLGGDVMEARMARWALERGGHVRIGLEDYAGPRTPTNLELLNEVVALCGEVGRPVATCVEARRALGLSIPL